MDDLLSPENIIQILIGIVAVVTVIANLRTGQRRAQEQIEKLSQELDQGFKRVHKRVDRVGAKVDGHAAHLTEARMAIARLEAHRDRGNSGPVSIGGN